MIPVLLLCGPPAVSFVCYYAWRGGENMAARQLGLGCSPLTVTSAGVSAASAWAAYDLQYRLWIRHFDEGGKYAYGHKKGVESLGESLQIKTWGQFYRAAGPRVLARTSAVIASCFVGGAAHAAVSAYRPPQDAVEKQ